VIQPHRWPEPLLASAQGQVEDEMEPTVPRQTLGEVVVTRVKQLIVDQGLQPGDRLPTEQELAVRFGVSRLSVREATRTLNFLGIIRAAPRRGLTVGEFDVTRIAEILGYHHALVRYPGRQLVQARLVIEVGALPFAAERLAGEPELREHLLELAARTEDETLPEAFIEGEIAFHRALVETSGIGPLVLFSDILHAFFRRFQETVVAHRHDEGVRQHCQLVELLGRGRLAKAEAVLRGHLQAFLAAEQEG
jgi:DNA-binding FadR family transcriptional regulator